MKINPFLSTLVFTSLLAQSAVGQNLLPSNDFVDPQVLDAWGLDASQVYEDSDDGRFAAIFTNRRNRVPSEPVPIDPDGTYIVRFWVKAADPQKVEYGFVRLAYLDTAGNRIDSFSVLPDPETHATLAEDADEGSSRILLNPASTGWMNVPRSQTGIVFGAEEDFSDLPNSQAVRIEKVNHMQDRIEVLLDEPLLVSYPAGTPVRRHLGAPMALRSFETGPDWKLHDLLISGSSFPQEASSDQFWNGTEAVELIVGVGKGREAEHRFIQLLLRDIELEKLD